MKRQFSNVIMIISFVFLLAGCGSGLSPDFESLELPLEYGKVDKDVANNKMAIISYQLSSIDALYALYEKALEEKGFVLKEEGSTNKFEEQGGNKTIHYVYKKNNEKLSVKMVQEEAEIVVFLEFL